jgi:2-polyprenyl-6-methoxyphenol hydroxylase-like FAD-dependent oxidoreductase
MIAAPLRTDVVIAGAGPTGLALGCVLAAEGVPFVLVDRQAEGANTSRAAVIHARTLEVLEALQVTDRLCAEGLVVPRFILRDRDRALATIRFDHLPTRHPYTLMIPQYRTEAILLARLRELGGDVCRPLAVRSVRQDPGGVRVTAVGDGGVAREIRARFLVGADGMHSTVREHSGIAFTGDAYAQSFVLADVHMDWGLANDEVMLFLSPEGLVVVAPLPGGAHRVVATQDDAPEHPDLAHVQALLDTRGPTSPPARVRDIIWSSRFRVHHRLADAYRAGNILLAGDAAHVHSPAGGQGMNTGIQDGIALGQLLVRALRTGDDAVLDDYERTRRPVAAEVVAFTDRMTRMATLRGRRQRVLRNTALRAVGRLPMVRAGLARRIAGLHRR